MICPVVQYFNITNFFSFVWFPDVYYEEQETFAREAGGCVVSSNFFEKYTLNYLQINTYSNL